MFKHEPECLHDWPDLPICICDELRKSQKRVLDSAHAASLNLPKWALRDAFLTIIESLKEKP